MKPMQRKIMSIRQLSISALLCAAVTLTVMEGAFADELKSYKVIELVGTSKNDWEDAAKVAVEQAGSSLRGLRVAEVSELDITLDDSGQVALYRAKVKVKLLKDSKDSD
jgi:hypothetical protein